MDWRQKSLTMEFRTLSKDTANVGNYVKKWYKIKVCKITSLVETFYPV